MVEKEIYRLDSIVSTPPSRPNPILHITSPKKKQQQQQQTKKAVTRSRIAPTYLPSRQIPTPQSTPVTHRPLVYHPSKWAMFHSACPPPCRYLVARVACAHISRRCHAMPCRASFRLSPQSTPHHNQHRETTPMLGTFDSSNSITPMAANAAVTAKKQISRPRSKSKYP